MAASTVRITVRGRLGCGFAAAFTGMTLQVRGANTCIVGEVRDQAELFGLLTRIRDLGLELDCVRVQDGPAPFTEEDRNA